jgi:undecaprenyl diphosphate synthase
MDGNGRWATKQGKSRVEGHRVGSEVVRELTIFASKESRVKTLTLYAFSTENWKRPKHEVEFLMRLLGNYLDKELDTYLENGVKFRAVGDISKFSSKLQNSIQNLEEKTQHLTSLTQNLALNYGGKDDIVRSVKRVLKSGDEVSEESIEKNLDVSYPIDIFIRTGGDSRVSNFLLWQISYAELFFTNTLFPDFTKEEFLNILNRFETIHRRFGGL